MRARHVTRKKKDIEIAEGWRDKLTRVKEPGTFANGLPVEKARYDIGFQPYRKALDKLVLPPRYPKGDLRNMARALAVVNAMRETKEELDPGHYERERKRREKKCLSKPE